MFYFIFLVGLYSGYHPWSRAFPKYVAPPLHLGFGTYLLWECPAHWALPYTNQCWVGISFCY